MRARTWLQRNHSEKCSAEQINLSGIHVFGASGPPMLPNFRRADQILQDNGNLTSNEYAFIYSEVLCQIILHEGIFRT